MSTPALHLIQAGLCSAACLCGADESLETCSCRCRGEYHGALAYAHVEADLARRPWWRGLASSASVPVLPDGRTLRRILDEEEAAERESRPAAYVTIGHGRTISAHCLAPDTAPWMRLRPDQHRRLGWFLAVLDHVEGTMSAFDESSACIRRIADREQAVALAALLAMAYRGKSLTAAFQALCGYSPDERDVERRAVITWASDMTDDRHAIEEHATDRAWQEAAASIRINLTIANPKEKP